MVLEFVIARFVMLIGSLTIGPLTNI